MPFIRVQVEVGKGSISKPHGRRPTKCGCLKHESRGKNRL